MEAVHLGAGSLVVFGIASLLTATVSGVAGGGAGFINAPLLIFLGLSPAQAVATGKLSGLSTALSSIGGMRGSGIKSSKRQMIGVMGLALAVGIVSPFVITNLDSEVYRRIIGIVLLLMIPVLLFKRRSGGVSTKPSKAKQLLGYGSLAPALLMQGVFGAGMGTLVNIVLMSFLGMSALESSLLKRYTQVALNVIITGGILFSGLIVWQVACIGICTSALGAFIGARIAVKKGNSIVTTALVLLTLVSAVYLILG